MATKAKKAAKAPAKRPVKKAAKPVKKAAKPTKKHAGLRGAKGRSGGGGVSLVGITFTDSSGGSEPNPEQTTGWTVGVTAYTGAFPELVVLGQSNFVFGLGTSDGYMPWPTTPPSGELTVLLVYVVQVMRGNPQPPLLYSTTPRYLTYGTRLTGPADGQMKLSVTLHPDLSVSVTAEAC